MIMCDWGLAVFMDISLVHKNNLDSIAMYLRRLPLKHEKPCLRHHCVDTAVFQYQSNQGPVPSQGQRVCYRISVRTDVTFCRLRRLQQGFRSTLCIKHFKSMVCLLPYRTAGCLLTIGLDRSCGAFVS